MATISRQRTLFAAGLLALLITAGILATPVPIQAADTPRRGGILLAVVAAEPPSLDPHQKARSPTSSWWRRFTARCSSSTR